MKYITTIVLALGFSVSVALAGENPIKGQLACAKCTAKIKGAGCSPAFIFKGKDGKTLTLLIKGKAVKGKGCGDIAHGKFCKPGTKLDVTLTGVIKEGTIVASKCEQKK